MEYVKLINLDENYFIFWILFCLKFTITITYLLGLALTLFFGKKLGPDYFVYE